MSHVNSYTRGVLDGRCAWDEFVARHGEPGRLFLGRLGLRRIPPSEVILDPYLLGKRFERLAAKAVLRKNGVPTNPEPPPGPSRTAHPPPLKAPVPRLAGQPVENTPRRRTGTRGWGNYAPEYP